MRKFFFITVSLFFPCLITHAGENTNNIDAQINQLLKSHYNQYQQQEYFSGIALSTYKPHQAIKNYYIGRVAQQNNSNKIDATTLFEIGSITKSFTAALVLQLEQENKLHLQDTLQHWLPDYSKWSTLTLQSLLNMTSGLPNYSDSPLMNTAVFEHPQQVFSNSALIDFVYPNAEFSPPLKSGYFYSNTGYILTAMILEKITGQNLQTLIAKRLLQPAQLENTFYPLPHVAPEVMARLAHGYSYNPYENPESLGKDVKMQSLSWAASAGALLSNTSDIIQWVKALFVEDKILAAQQKNELMQLVSIPEGNALAKTSADHPRAFALGVSQGFDKDMGLYWFYEGETEGFRALYMYVPSNGIIIAAVFNSAVNGENDHAGDLMKKAYQLVLKS